MSVISWLSDAARAVSNRIKAKRRKEKMSKWAYSFNGEDFTAGYDSKEEAINDAVEATAQLPFPDENIYVGECVEPGLDWRDFGNDVICNIKDNLADEYSGDYADYFDEEVTAEKEEMLNAYIDAAVCKWIEDYEIKAGFYGITNDEKVDITDKIKAIRIKTEDTDDDGEMGI